MAVIELNDRTFFDYISTASKPVLVDVWASWCIPCVKMTPLIEDLASNYGAQIDVVKVEADKAVETVAAFGITSIPTLILFVNGQVKSMATGAQTYQEITENFIKEFIE